MTGKFKPDNNVLNHGHLVIIGGGRRPDNLMLEFIRLAGGFNSQITIIPSASHFPEQRAIEIKAELENLGCLKVNYIWESHNQIDVSANLQKLEDTKGIFFTGGDQNKLAQFLLGTKVLDRIKDIYREGGVIAGTSAGAAIMSRIMIAGYDPDWDDSIETPLQSALRPKSVRLSEGFGFLSDIIIDQHFNTRKRTARLKDAVNKNPGMLGIGIDESTAIIVHGGNAFRVLGENNVTLYSVNDFGLIQQEGNTVNFLGAGEVITLVQGDRYMLNNYSRN